MFDACVSFYQWACFPIYGIRKVRRADYLVFDRHHLGYLHFIEKFPCTYCEYGNGLVSYMAEILARGFLQRVEGHRGHAVTLAIRKPASRP